MLGGIEFIPPLAELSDLLGVSVTGVRHIGVWVNGQRPTQPNRWRFLINARWTDHIPSRWLRDGRTLTVLAIRWGRDPDLPALARKDGRRVLRLAHEVVENTTDTKETQR